MTGRHQANEGDGFLTRCCKDVIVPQRFNVAPHVLQHKKRPIKLLLLQISFELLLVDNKAAVVLLNALPSRSI